MGEGMSGSRLLREVLLAGWLGRIVRWYLLPSIEWYEDDG